MGQQEESQVYPLQPRADQLEVHSPIRDISAGLTSAEIVTSITDNKDPMDVDPQGEEDKSSSTNKPSNEEVELDKEDEEDPEL